MRNRFLRLVVVLVASLLISSIAFAQDYDPRDFTGFWDRAGRSGWRVPRDLRGEEDPLLR